MKVSTRTVRLANFKCISGAVLEHRKRYRISARFVSRLRDGNILNLLLFSKFITIIVSIFFNAEPFGLLDFHHVGVSTLSCLRQLPVQRRIAYGSIRFSFVQFWADRGCVFYIAEIYGLFALNRGLSAQCDRYPVVISPEIIFVNSRYSKMKHHIVVIILNAFSKFRSKIYFFYASFSSLKISNVNLEALPTKKNPNGMIWGAIFSIQRTHTYKF